MTKNNLQTYGFQAHLRPEFPSQIVVDVTENCNLSCIHCPHASLKKSGKLGGGFLLRRLHDKLIDEIAHSGREHCKYIRYTGQGETLLHPEIIHMLEYASKFSEVPKNVTTNGALMNEALSVRLLECGVDVIDISIDAFKAETYAAIRRKGDLLVTRSNVVKLLELRDKGSFGTRVVVSFVEQALNRHEVDDFKKFWEEQGADFVVVRRMHTAAGAGKNISPLAEERFPCLYPWERVSLGADGFIHFCPQDWVHGSSFADFRNRSIAQAWTGGTMRNIRKAHLENDFSSLEFCGKCSDWRHTRWPGSGRSYSDMMSEFKGAESS